LYSPHDWQSRCGWVLAPHLAQSDKETFLSAKWEALRLPWEDVLRFVGTDILYDYLN